MPNLTSEQQSAVRGVIKKVKSSDQVTSFSGAAGTGKTTCLAVISEALPSFATCSYTGKACDVLRNKGMDASTIHSLIYKPNTLPNGKVEFILKFADDLTCDGFLIDESSLINQEIYEDLLSFDLPIVFVGDHAQLEPIGKDINLMANPDFKLETIHRNAGEIAFFADHLRKGQLPHTFPTTEKVVLLTKNEITPEIMADTDQMICAFNRTRVSKNKKLREFLGYTELVEVGERIICLRNNKKLGLFNGLQGEVLKVNKNKLKFRTDNGVIYKNIVFDLNQFGKEKNEFDYGIDTPNPFDYANCISCHKSQGSQFDKVLVFEQNCDLWEKKRWTYTAASRAKEQLIWVGEKKHIPVWLK